MGGIMALCSKRHKAKRENQRFTYRASPQWRRKGLEIFCFMGFKLAIDENIMTITAAIKRRK